MRALKKGKYGTVQYVSENYVVRNKDLISKHVFAGNTRLVSKTVMQEEKSGTMVSTEQGSYYYHPDHLGSSSVVTDKTGKFYEQIEYFPYGETWIHNKADTEQESTPYKFTAKELDVETGLYYYGARYYDPKLSRWVSADPPLATGAYLPSGNNDDPPGMGGVFNTINLDAYHYAGDNPIKITDPDGNFSTNGMEDCYQKIDNPEAKAADAGSGGGKSTDSGGFNKAAHDGNTTGSNSSSDSTGLLDKLGASMHEVGGNINKTISNAVNDGNYLDINISGGFIFGLTGGIIIDNEQNIRLYYGAGLTTPGGGVSCTWSFQNVTEGINYGAQVQIPGIAGQVGYSNGKFNILNNYSSNNWFYEGGGSVTSPGASLSCFNITKPIYKSRNYKKGK